MSAIFLLVLIAGIGYSEFVKLPRDNHSRGRYKTFNDRMQCAGCFENADGARCPSARGIFQGMRRGYGWEGRRTNVRVGSPGKF